MTEADKVRLLLGPVYLTALSVIVRRGGPVAGRLLLAVAFFHISAGLWVGRKPLGRIWRKGFLGKADSGLGHQPSDIPQEMVFWFLLWGASTGFLAHLIIYLQERDIPIPRFLAFELGISSLLAALLYPKGGFWWMLIPALLLRRPRG